MSQFSEDNLEILRQRATCPVCRTFFTQPKKLSGCPHVFCLQCIEFHLRANSHLNFPKCPMCRKPMLKPRSEIHQYEPARAEEDVAGFVKQFEVCDVCNKPEDPSLRCLNCGLICRNCEPCHRKLKPSHTVEPVLCSGSRNKSDLSYSGSETCTKHPEQQVSFLCIVCLETVCVICKDYPFKNHKNCNLHDFPYNLSTLLKPYFNNANKNLSQFLHIADISKDAYDWLNERYGELKQCVDALREYNKTLREIKCTVNPDIKREVEEILRIGERLFVETENILKLHADADTAICVLKSEPKYKLFFQLVRQLPPEPSFMTADMYLSDAGQSIRQVLKCSLYKVSNIFTGIMIFGRQPEKVVDTYKVLADYPYYQLITIKNLYAAMMFPQFPAEENKDVHSLQDTEDPLYSDGILTLVACISLSVKQCIIPGNTCLYTSDIIPWMEVIPWHIYTHCVKISDRYVFPQNTCTCTRFFIDFKTKNIGMFCDRPHFPESSKSYHGSVTSYLATNFINCFKQPFYYIQESGKDCVFAFSGNRRCGCGLETLFVHYNWLEMGKAYATCINTFIAKFHRTCTPLESQSEYSHPYESWKILDTHKKFSQTFYHYDSGDERTIARSCYQTEITETCVPTNFLIRTAYMKGDIKPNKRQYIVPAKYLKLELLCGFDNDLYFVQHDSENKIIVGRLHFASKQEELHNMCLIKQDDIDLPVNSLKPLTMTKTTAGEVIAVCSVEGDSSKFVIIRPNKSKTSAIEYLEVRYPTKNSGSPVADPEASVMVTESSVERTVARMNVSIASVENTVEDSVDRINDTEAVVEDSENSAKDVETHGKVSEAKAFDKKFEKPLIVTEATANILEASVEELEMSPDGDIFYILKAKNGRCYCVTTKYFINE